MELRIPITKEDINSQFGAMLKEFVNETIQDVRKNELETKDFLNCKETCTYLNVSFPFLQKLERLGLKSVVVDGKKLFIKSTVQEFMKSLEQ